MKAMVLAAGLGTRLRPLTNDRPKALVEIGGRTLLEITLTRLKAFGIREVIVNAHHFASMVVEYLKANQNFGMSIEVSCEETLLDTGGGLKNAAWFFLQSDGGSHDEDTFILHNVDVISTVDLNRMAQFHHASRALVTLAVQDRKSSRYLFFDQQLELCGRRLVKEEKTEMVRAAPPAYELAFSGIHVISTRLFQRMTEEGVFPIIHSYLRLAAQGEKITAFRADEYYWRDLGRPESVALAAEELKNLTTEAQRRGEEQDQTPTTKDTKDTKERT
jgi:NDP-sugar pyrophosphorylase family protein